MKTIRGFTLLLILPAAMLAQSAQTSTPVTRDERRLVPQTSFDGPFLEFDFPALQIGVAEYAEGPTGATVFYFPKRAVGTVDVRGGSPGTTNTDWLRLGYDSPSLDAITFAGGSWYGLEVADGVRAGLLELNQNTTLLGIPNVAGAIVFDFGDRQNSVYPDKELGRAALKSARTGQFPLGARGAGRFVAVGRFPIRTYREQAGQGGAFRQVGSTKVAVFTVVNAGGAIFDRQGKVVRGFRDPRSGVRLSLSEVVSGLPGVEGVKVSAAQTDEPRSPSNTTLTLVVTNQKLNYAQLQRLAIQVHTSMARAIQPFQAQGDGDVLFAVTTSEIENPNLPLRSLVMIASEVAWDAVLSCVPKTDEMFRAGSPKVAERQAIKADAQIYDAYVGRYRVKPEYFFTVTKEQGKLLLERPGNPKVELLPESETVFFLKETGQGEAVDAQVEFTKDEKAGVMHLIYRRGGQQIRAERIK